MNKIFFMVLFVMIGFSIFAQELPTVAVATFDVMGGITRDEASVITELFTMELVSKGTIKVVDRGSFDRIIAEMKFQASDWSDNQKTARLGKALNADYVISGQLMKMGNKIYMTSKMLDVKTTQILSSVREELKDLSDVYNILPNYCRQLIPNIGPLSDFAGTWYSSATTNLSAILEFYADGSIIIKQYQDGYLGSGDKIFTGSGRFAIDNNKINISLNLLKDGKVYGVSTSSFFEINSSKTSFTLKNSTLWSYSNHSPYSIFVKGGK